MRSLALVLFFCSTAVSLSCSLFQGGSAAPAPPVIRFVNLKYVYDYMINKSKDAKDLSKKKDDAISSMKNLEAQMKDGKITPELELNYQRKKQLYIIIAKEEDEYKKKMSLRINQALSAVAESSGVDYILNIGDEVIYGKKKYDITEDVIHEVANIGKKNEPLSR